jgi:hypothetical protein
MSAQPHDHAPRPVPERTPKAVRAALPQEDQVYFDRDFQAAMAEATKTLDLAPVFDCIDRWRHQAVLKASGAYDEIMATAERAMPYLERGETPPGAGRWHDAYDERLRERIARGK